MTRLLAALWLALTALPAAAAAEDAAHFGVAVAAAQKRDWAGAEAAAARSGEVAQAVARWLALRAGGPPLAEYRAWLDGHPDWPDRDRIMARADEAAARATPAEALDWFAANPPQGLAARQAQIAALAATGGDAATALGHLWREASLTAEEEAALRASHGTALRPHHAGRLEAALSARRWAEAERMLPDVIPAQAALARARIALQARHEGVDALIAAVPPALANHAGLMRDRFDWRLRAGQTAAARDLLGAADAHPAALGDPADWAAGRLRLARGALEARDWASLRAIAAPHRLTSGSDFADLEWLAGYGALKAGEPYAALSHFGALRAGVTTPISLSRAGYWEGRAYEAAGDLAAAHLAYAYAAGVGGSAYYGQLAAERAGLPMPDEMAGMTPLPDWRGAPALRDNPLWQAAVWLHVAGQPDLSRRFLLQLVRSLPEGDVPRVTRFALELHNPHLALTLGKAAALRGIVVPAALYPSAPLMHLPMPVAPELALSIARRESEFNAGVTSSAGALGLMQVMPDTGRMMAEELGIAFDLPRMTEADYNARLGTAYLKHLQDQFGTSIALVAAGYNAGPSRPKRWSGLNGDPRDAAVDAVDWVEAIPFAETRNYVMRVAEALPLYRARLAGAAVPWGAEAALRGTDPAVIPPAAAPAAP